MYQMDVDMISHSIDGVLLDRIVNAEARTLSNASGESPPAGARDPEPCFPGGMPAGPPERADFFDFLGLLT